MKPETLLKHFKTFCVLCRRKIPKSRHRRRAITCSALHQKRLTKLRKIERDHRLCSVCGKPSTPEQRRQFRLFNSSLVKQAASRRSKAKKGILGSAKGTQTLEDFAYVVKIPPKRPKRQIEVVNG